jgi:hypothetical protein
LFEQLQAVVDWIGGTEEFESEEKIWKDRELQSAQYFHFLSIWLPLGKVMTGQS